MRGKPSHNGGSASEPMLTVRHHK